MPATHWAENAVSASQARDCIHDSIICKFRRRSGCGMLRTKVAKLKLAKHRADSAQKPLGRMILLFEALWLTSEFIFDSRPAKNEGRLATQMHRRRLCKELQGVVVSWSRRFGIG